MQFKLEVIAYNIESCHIAQQAGAHRIELCANPADGGTTPPYGFIKAARKNVSIELYCMIRPRGGDFLYSGADFEIMKTDVQIAKQLGCDGVVIGILNPDGSIDKDRCKKLVELAYPMGVTFHRAFDRVKDAHSALNDVIETGCERILTSGLQPECTEGATLIAKLIQQAADRIVIMPGSGLNAENIIEVAKITGAREFHTSAKCILKSTMKFTRENMKEELLNISANGEVLKKMVNLLKNHL